MTEGRVAWAAPLVVLVVPVVPVVLAEQAALEVPTESEVNKMAVVVMAAMVAWV